MTDNGLRKMRESDIDAHLKRAFKELADEGLPDRFNDLLAQLRHGDAGKARHDNNAYGGAGQAGSGLDGTSKGGTGPAATARVNGVSRKKMPDGQGAGVRKGDKKEIAEPVTADKPGARHRR